MHPAGDPPADLVEYAVTHWGPVPRIALATAQEVGERLHERGLRDAELAAAKLAVLAAAETRRHELLARDAERLRETKVAGWARWRATRRDQV
jgi:hypothetical protein